jgi:hypothetical protein
VRDGRKKYTECAHVAWNGVTTRSVRFGREGISFQLGVGGWVKAETNAMRQEMSMLGFDITRGTENEGKAAGVAR